MATVVVFGALLALFVTIVAAALYRSLASDVDWYEGRWRAVTARETELLRERAALRRQLQGLGVTPASSSVQDTDPGGVAPVVTLAANMLRSIQTGQQRVWRAPPASRSERPPTPPPSRKARNARLGAMRGPGMVLLPEHEAEYGEALPDLPEHCYSPHALPLPNAPP